MPRFVLLYHNCPPEYERPSHWDLMLETGDALRTWALARLPRDWTTWHAQAAAVYPDCPPIADGDAVAVERLADHRVDYLDQEGPLTGDRGEVTRIDRGTYERLSHAAEDARLTLFGSHWEGSIRLQQASADSTQWTATAIPAAD
jgi:hypothetical protein